MTVKELIIKLLEFPPETVVIHSICSDYDELPEPELIKAEDKKVAFRNGRYQRWQRYYKDEDKQVFVTAVHFDGN